MIKNLILGVLCSMGLTGGVVVGQVVSLQEVPLFNKSQLITKNRSTHNLLF